MKNRSVFCRLVCLTLAALLLLSAAACGESKDGQETTPQTPVTPSDAETEPAETEREKPLDYLGAHDFGDRTYTSLVSGMDNGEWRQNPIDADAENAEVINSARFNRNIEVEDTLHVKLASVEQFGNGGIVLQELKNSVKANDELYQNVILCMTDSAKVTLEGYFLDLYTIPGLQLDGAWWDQRSIEDMTINHKLYHAVNSMITTTYNATFAILFNKVLADKYHVESPYQDVLDGKWTYDVLHGMMDGISNDLNGNGQMDKDDLFGLCLWVDSIVAAINSGLEYCARVNEDGEVVMTLETERVQDIVDKFISFAANPDITADYIYLNWSSYDLFAGDHALFYMQEINRITAFRDMESDFGILPMPKYNEEQTEYRSCVAENDGVLLSVPIIMSDPDFTGYVLEALARLSEEYVMPAYYDITLQRKAARDEESSKMLDIIFHTRAYDLGWIYQIGAFKNPLKQIVQGQSSNISALVKKHTNVANKALKTINAFYQGE